MVCLMFPNQVAHSLKVTYQAVRLWSGQLKKRDTAMLSTPSLPPPPQPMDAHKSFPPLSNVSKQWAARGLQLRQFTDICLPQFGKFLVYWDKLCLCSQMFKVQSQCSFENQVWSRAKQDWDRVLPTGLLNQPDPTQCQMPAEKCQFYESVKIAAVTSRSVDGAPSPPAGAAAAEMKESSRAAFPPVYSGLSCSTPPPPILS